MAESDRKPVDHSLDPFGSTHWSVVLAAGDDGASAHDALQALCVTYWLPVYGYVRSRVAGVDEAEDLTQAFFLELLERRIVASANPARGQFRAFLLTSLKHFLINQHAHDVAQKRGGGRAIVPLDREFAETRLSSGGRSPRTPEQEFERRWALTLLDLVLQRLAREQADAGRAKEFAALCPLLTGDQQRSQVAIAASLGVTSEAVRAATYRLRRRYRGLLRDEVRQTVASPEEVDEELQRLISAVSC